MKFYRFIISLVCLCCCLVAGAESVTGARGIVYDAETGETLPMVQVFFVAPGDKVSGMGTTSDLDGRFEASNTKGLIQLRFQMMGYKTETITLLIGKTREDIKVRLKPEAIAMEEVVVRPKKEKNKYKRKGNPAVELIKEVIANKDKYYVKQADHYTADTYHRMSFALDNFHPNFEKGFWKPYAFAEKYIDTTEVYDALTVSIRENISNEYYQRRPRKEKHIMRLRRVFGLEDILGSAAFRKNIDNIFAEVDIRNDNMALLFNRFVSPISSSLAVSYYQYYIQDTLVIEGDSVIDLSFVPVNSESYSFTGHLYIMKDSTYQIKRYKMAVPQHINLNFVDNYSIEQNFVRQEDGKWAPERVTICAKFSIFKRFALRARQTKIYTGWDFESEIDKTIFSAMTAENATEEAQKNDSTAVRLVASAWDTLRPEPLTFYESSVYDMVQEFLSNKNFCAIANTVNALTTQYVTTSPARLIDESKFDFGPLYDFVSWNMLEGVRLRIGGMTTSFTNPQWFFSGYVAFGCKDLRPKFSVSLIHTFTPKKYQPYEQLRNNLSFTLQHDVEEPGQLIGVIDRDNLLMSIPLSKPTMKNYQYVSHAKVEYLRDWENKMTLRTHFDFSHNEAAGALNYSRVAGYGANSRIAYTERVPHYNCYEGMVELRWTPGAFAPLDRMGQESTFNMEKDAPLMRIRHFMGYLDDRYSGGKGFYYNQTEITAEKRFWFSSFGHLDARIQGGIVWNQVPFTKLYIPQTSTSIFLAQNAFNQMQPMEFLMDKYVALYATYYFKGWILNRIPGINRLKLRGVVSFSGLYGGLSKKNNPYLPGNEGLYKFSDAAEFDQDGYYVSGYTSTPIDYHMPYMEITAGFENIFKFIRIDYVRRLTYNDYMLPDGVHHRRVGAWGRNGVKISIRFAL